MLYDFNPIPYWKTGSSASMMSPTHSCIASSYSKKGNNAKLSSGFLANDLIEDKENGLAIALDFPDLDQKGDDKFTLGFGLSFDLHSDTKRRKGRRELSKLSNTPYFYP